MKYIVVTILFFISTNAQSGQTAGDLLKQCNTAISYFDTGKSLDMNSQTDFTMCGMYIRGFSDALDIVGIVCRSQNKELRGRCRLSLPCFPPNIAGEQLIRIFVKYAKDNPKKLHFSAVDLLFMALYDAFPYYPDQENCNSSN